MKRLVLLLGLVLFCGCESRGKGKMVPIEELPAGMLDKAKQALPEVVFDSAVLREDGSYEVKGKAPNGKVRDVEFNKEMKVIEIE